MWLRLTTASLELLNDNVTWSIDLHRCIDPVGLKWFIYKGKSVANVNFKFYKTGFNCTLLWGKCTIGTHYLTSKQLADSLLRRLTFCTLTNYQSFSQNETEQKWAASQQNLQNDICVQWRLRSAWASASRIRVFAVRMKKHWVLSYPLSALRRLWSDWVDALADPSLCWAQISLLVLSWVGWNHILSLLNSISPGK